jgi:hypothetical protein
VGLLDRLLRGTPPATPAEADRIAVLQLQGIGADLARPRHVLHFLTFPDEASARGAAAELERAGYRATVDPPDDAEPEWSVRGEGARVVSLTTVEAFRSWFEKIATEFGGGYDGWEAAPKP